MFILLIINYLASTLGIFLVVRTTISKIFAYLCNTIDYEKHLQKYKGVVEAP